MMNRKGTKKIGTVVFIQRGDFKSKQILKKVEEKHLVKYIDSSPIFFPIKILPFVIKYFSQKKRWVFIYRYLNDYPSLSKTLSRALSEYFVVIISKLFNGDVYWICHNVDKETARYYPKISEFRRNLLNLHASRVFVMQKHLVKYYNANFDREKVDFLSFGYIESKLRTDSNVIDLLRMLKSGPTKIAWSAGQYAAKTTYIEKTIDFAALNPDISFVMVISRLPDETLNKLNNVTNIHVLKGPLVLNEDEVAEYIDFFWRSYDDLSVPFSVFNAVKNRKKILCMKEGFLSEIVERYEIGIVLSAVARIPIQVTTPLKEEVVTRFEEENNWGIPSNKLLRLINELN